MIKTDPQKPHPPTPGAIPSDCLDHPCARRPVDPDLEFPIAGVDANGDPILANGGIWLE